MLCLHEAAQISYSNQVKRIQEFFYGKNFTPITASTFLLGQAVLFPQLGLILSILGIDEKKGLLIYRPLNKIILFSFTSFMAFCILPLLSILLKFLDILKGAGISIFFGGKLFFIAWLFSVEIRCLHKKNGKSWAGWSLQSVCAQHLWGIHGVLKEFLMSSWPGLKESWDLLEMWFIEEKEEQKLFPSSLQGASPPWPHLHPALGEPRCAVTN